MIDELLKKSGLKYEDLNKAEKETLNSMLDTISKSSMNVEKLREYITQMKFAVEEELSKEPERIWFFFRNDKNILLKARIRNYMFIESFLDTPKRAKEALERALAGMIPEGK